MVSAGVRGRLPVSLIASVATVRRRCHRVSMVLLHDNVVVMQRDPLPVREATRPAGEPIWVSLRQIFKRVADYVENDARRAESVAMEKIVRDHPALNASYLERVSRMQELLLDEARTRT